MSIHYSKCDLNTYSVTPYFAAHCPADYPLSLVLQKCRTFRRLPPNLRELSALAKRWAAQNYPVVVEEMGRWYDEAGNELDPETGERLTAVQIDAQWHPDPALDQLKATDIPAPEGGFPDPDVWLPGEETGADDDAGNDGPTEAQILSDIAGHGRDRTAREYGVPEEHLAGIESDQELAQVILKKRG